ncbi:MAG: DUF547 domain-containing protein [bacterium]
MRKFALLGVAALVAAGCAAFLAGLRKGSPVVVDTKAHAATGGGNATASLDAVDHSTWDRLLRTYVDEDGMVDYAAWKASEADRAALSEYLATLSRANPTAQTSKAGKLAFWINAYNALTIHGILKEYPTSSIRNHTAKLVGYNIWDDLLLPVGDQDYSLNEIEHEILRKLGEPRIHFAIVCASVGCPRLLNRAYTPAKLEEQLAMNTRDFFSRDQNFQIDVANRRVRVSAILDWFGEDFGPSPRKGLAGLAQYLPGASTRQLVGSEDFAVTFLDYDWSLNEQ